MSMNKTMGWLLAELQVPMPEGCDSEQTIHDLCLDSRAVQAGDVFMALSGFKVHGMDYAYQAERAGAIAVLTEPVKADRAAQVGRQKPLGIPVIEVPDLSAQLGPLACAFYDHPSAHLQVIAVTGTNGKTSTAWLLMHALEQLGQKTGYLGTLGAGDMDQLQALPNTTPSALAIQQQLAQMRQRGCQQVCVEVSSHALTQDRFSGTQVAAALFTNLSRDHLDYHKTMKAYAAAKRKLFTDFAPEVSIINADDEVGLGWLQQDLATANTRSYGLGQNGLDYQATDIHLEPAGLAFALQHGGQSVQFTTELLGEFNVQNVLAVIATLHHQGHDLAALVPVVAALQPVPGRMNRIDNPSNGSTLVVDYAHTPDALEQVLKALRAHTQGQLWCVFGCGGNRDKGKRAMMGAIAEQWADKVVLTDDNPRFESSAQIIADIEFGMKTKPHVISNRQQAIAHAIDQSEAGDIVLLAGKGHESTQEINGKLIPFNDMQVIKQLMQVAV
ncbi:UDP-N-acetylmuramoyl-L-alanyl-D-glutamate--2,6-diaminopimelate ligase [Marinicella meishanensis]|uniref:UDP-N-acetylmuramoyl-L-alanyl-D-glutamate--2, 6-diaminopimelate ligase n=1 Tax=Marinicella meishanensis TaxID=2873263 RepID=UPI001CC1443D|nr:UDP-N-acetylmuramoyl-L-alanyl-D-glutamate--2,6-diaminopimelate ligase [Marinicella sp. NBU2979]